MPRPKREPRGFKGVHPAPSQLSGPGTTFKKPEFDWEIGRKIVKGVEEGLFYWQIADEVGIDVSTIHRWKDPGCAQYNKEFAEAIRYARPTALERDLAKILEVAEEATPATANADALRLKARMHVTDKRHHKMFLPPVLTEVSSDQIRRAVEALAGQFGRENIDDIVAAVQSAIENE